MSLSCHLSPIYSACIWQMSSCHQYIFYSSAFHQHYLLVNVWTAAFLLPGGQTFSLHFRTPGREYKINISFTPTSIRQIYVDIPSINGWKIDRVWSLGGAWSSCWEFWYKSYFWKIPVLPFNLVGQATDALLHASVCCGKMESRRA